MNGSSNNEWELVDKIKDVQNIYLKFKCFTFRNRWWGNWTRFGRHWWWEIFRYQRAGPHIRSELLVNKDFISWSKMHKLLKGLLYIIENKHVKLSHLEKGIVILMICKCRLFYSYFTMNEYTFICEIKIVYPHFPIINHQTVPIHSFKLFFFKQNV